MNAKNNSLVIYLIIIISFWGDTLFSQTTPNSANRSSNSQIKFSDLNSWYFIQVKESSVIGGMTKKLYQIGNPRSSTTPEKNRERDPESDWATTNFFAKIGVDVGVTTVSPEKKDNGYCCRMESTIKSVDIIGIKIKVLVSGTLFLGDVIEPVESIKDPIKKLNHGISFTQRPKAVQFSYKYKVGQNRSRVCYGSSPVKGSDKGEFCMILQKRWEDNKGNVYAKRVGGTRCFFNDSGNRWVNDTTITILYGDLSKEPFYNPSIMGLIPQISELYVKNSRNKLVPLTETGWDRNSENPTHLVLYFTSSFEGIKYTGSPGSVLWVDDIRFIY
ncbi:MAG: PCMD domain-containing protein [Bacteroidales bacterium]|nr:PCMD domain-containing protein [Bacteroidales bacterium]